MCPSFPDVPPEPCALPALRAVAPSGDDPAIVASLTLLAGCGFAVRRRPERLEVVFPATGGLQRGHIVAVSAEAVAVRLMASHVIAMPPLASVRLLPSALAQAVREVWPAYASWGECLQATADGESPRVVMRDALCALVATAYDEAQERQGRAQRVVRVMPEVTL